MSEENNQPLISQTAPKAEVRTKQGLQAVWLIPLIALVIGGWLAYKAFSEKGPLISISFSTADGLEAGKTKIKFRDVVVGEVEEILLSESLDGVVVLARMNKAAKPYLTDKTRFWVVRARISAGEVSGLGTLLSGAYIGIDPILDGARTKSFTGLSKQPLVTANVPGQHYMLRTSTLGSLNLGSPIYYRQIKVGEVVDYDFSQSGEAVDVKIFIHAPHHERVNSATRFWNASGIDFKLDSTGIKVDTQSLVSILQGGIAFDMLPSLAAETEVSDNFQFLLHPNREAATKKNYAIKTYYLMYFNQSVRGLVAGAPVEFRGIQIGEVVDYKLVLDTDSQEARIPVLVMIEPERLELWTQGQKVDYRTTLKEKTGSQLHPMQEKLLKHGMRAQLKTGNLLTGQLYVDIDIYPEAEPILVTYEKDYPIFPTVPAPLGQIAEDVSSILKKINAIPFQELGVNLNETIITLKSTLHEYKKVAGNVNQQVIPHFGQALANINKQILPNLNQTMEDLQDTMAGLKKTVGKDSALNFKTQQILDELTGAIRSIRSVADQLDRNPRALIFGRGESKQ